MDDRRLFRFAPDYRQLPNDAALDWSEWGGFAAAAEMCNNNGACRARDAGVMCPSYRATSDEQHLHDLDGIRNHPHSWFVLDTGWVSGMFKLAESRVSNQGLYCGSEGLYLGASPLIHHNNGTYRLRPEGEITALLGAVYDPAPDVESLVPRLHTVADALQRGDLAQAMISALLLRLEELSETGLARLAAAEALLKANFDPAQPRDQHGRWTTDGSSSSTSEGTGASRPALTPAQEILPFGARPPLFFDEPPQTFRPFKEPIPRLSGREGSKDIPSWARGKRPYVGENGRDYAKRAMDERYGPGNWEQTRAREYNQLKKYGDAIFVIHGRFWHRMIKSERA
jgi:hypothetical protein